MMGFFLGGGQGKCPGMKVGVEEDERVKDKEDEVVAEEGVKRER